MMIRLAIAGALAAAATVAHAEDAVPGSAPILASGLSANVSASGLWAIAGPVGADPWYIGVLAGEAHVGAIRGSMGISADVWAGRAHYAFVNDTTTTASVLGAGVHVNKRFDDGLFGGLVSVGASPNGYNATFLNTALEAQKDFGRLTVGAQAGYTQTLASTTAMYSLQAPDAWYAHGVARWFATDNLMLAGDLGYAGFTDANSADGDAWRWGARLEYKLRSAPVSAFVAYQGVHWRQPGMTAYLHGVMVGVSLIGGDETLAARYRGPAGLEDRNPFYSPSNAL